MVGAYLAMIIVFCATLATGIVVASGANARTPCWVSSYAYLTSADVYHQTHWKFTHWLTFKYSGFPIDYNRHFPPPPVAANFLAGQTEGFLTNISLIGKYKRENDAIARKLRYQIGTWPYVPLSGDIVLGHPRAVLEVYEDNFVWKTFRGAEAYMHLRAGSPGGEHGFAVHLGDQSKGTVFPSPAAGQETDVQVKLRLGSRGMRVTVEGGKDVTSAIATELAWTALQRARGACAADGAAT